MSLALISIAAISQQKLSGNVISASNQKPVAGATVSISSYASMADNKGHFVFPSIKKGTSLLKVTCIGYKEYEKQVSIDNADLITDIILSEETLYMQSLEVKSIRAANNSPFAKTNLNKEEIATNNLGQDLPYLLNQTPSVVINSDAGNGVGYTGIHIRGTDATRINVTMNGIPYNDAESQGTYFVDIPDIASSLSSIQVQRGVGTSSNGTGAFGATINLQTNEVNEKAYAELNNSYGSFNTWKNTIKVGTGLINNHFILDARLSKISSDGYIDRATSDFKSLALSAAYITNKSSLRFNIFTGKEKTYQAWYGVPDYIIDSARTYNQAGLEKSGAPYANQTDNYQQDHYQFFYNQHINNQWSFNTAVFITDGRGYYEEYKSGKAYIDYNPSSPVSDTGDLIRQLWLDNHFYGQILSVHYKNKKEELTIGGGWTRYEGSHYGLVVWTQLGSIDKDYQFYNHPALKTDNNIYAKWQHQLNTHLQSFVDIQYRNVYHRMDGFESNPTQNIAHSYDFINPKAGLTYTQNDVQVFLSYALGNKEPNRDDFQASLTSQPKAETLHDFELGVAYKKQRFSYAATLYYMLYKDQLVLTGKLNNVGNPVRINVDNSYRAGIELQGSYIFNKWLNATANITFSQNKINSFNEYIDNYDLGNQSTIHHSRTEISFSPFIIAGNTINILPCKNSTISLIGKYVGKQYLDNTQDDARSLNAYYAEDIRVSYHIKNIGFANINIIAQANNIFDAKYNSNGWTYPYIYGGSLINSNGYYPVAPLNYMVALNVKF